MKTTGLHCLRDNYLSSAMPHIYYLISRNASALSLLTTEFRFTKQSLFKKIKKYARSLNKEEFENGTQVCTDINQNLIQHSQVR